MTRFTMIALAVPLCLTSAPAAAQVSPTPEPPAIVTSGETILLRTPDRAYVQIGAEGRASKPGEAQQISARVMTGVQTTLKTLGFAADAIKTTSYTVQPEYDYQNGRQVFRDYFSRNVVEVRVDDLSKLSQVLDAAGTSGAATINGLRWDLKDRDAVELEALRLAVKQATERAQAMAAAAGRTLGPIIRLEEQRSSVQPPIIAFRGGAAAGAPAVGTPIEAGEIQVRAQVSLTIAIK